MPPRQVFGDPRGEEAPEPRFCHYCGAALDLHGRRCPRCRRRPYRGPRVGVCVLVRRGDAVLLGRRRATDRGAWALPGGLLEPGEDFLTAARREVREETGLDVLLTAVINVVTNHLEDGETVVTVVLEASAPEGAPRPGDDVEEVRWFPRRGPFPPMAFPGDAYILGEAALGRVPSIPTDPAFSGGSSHPGAAGG